MKLARLAEEIVKAAPEHPLSIQELYASLDFRGPRNTHLAIPDWHSQEFRTPDMERHEFLTGDFVAGEFKIVQACREKPHHWQICVDLDWIKGKKLPESLSLYFLVQQSDKYHFKMIGINFDRQEGCPGESQPNSESPSLFPSRENKAPGRQP